MTRVVLACFQFVTEQVQDKDDDIWEEFQDRTTGLHFFYCPALMKSRFHPPDLPPPSAEKGVLKVTDVVWQGSVPFSCEVRPKWCSGERMQLKEKKRLTQHSFITRSPGRWRLDHVTFSASISALASMLVTPLSPKHEVRMGSEDEAWVLLSLKVVSG